MQSATVTATIGDSIAFTRRAFSAPSTVAWLTRAKFLFGQILASECFY